MIMAVRGLVAAYNTLRARQITFFLAKNFGRRSEFFEDSTGMTIRVAIWDGKEFYLSSKDREGSNG